MGNAKFRLGDYKEPRMLTTSFFQRVARMPLLTITVRLPARNWEMKGSIEDDNKAIAINPKFAEAYYNRGNAYAEQGDDKAALKDYNKAIALTLSSPRLTTTVVTSVIRRVMLRLPLSIGKELHLLITTRLSIL